jgi:hypothetical protein
MFGKLFGHTFDIWCFYGRCVTVECADALPLFLFLGLGLVATLAVATLALTALAALAALALTTLAPIATLTAIAAIAAIVGATRATLALVADAVVRRVSRRGVYHYRHKAKKPY